MRGAVLSSAFDEVAETPQDPNNLRKTQPIRLPKKTRLLDVTWKPNEPTMTCCDQVF